MPGDELGDAPDAKKFVFTLRRRCEATACSGYRRAPRARHATTPRRAIQRAPVSAASAAAAASSAAAGSDAMRPRHPRIPYHEKTGEAMRLLVGSCSAAK